MLIPGRNGFVFADHFFETGDIDLPVDIPQVAENFGQAPFLGFAGAHAIAVRSDRQAEVYRMQLAVDFKHRQDCRRV